MQYINYLKSKATLSRASPSEKPVLSDEDEQFLNRITSQDVAPPLPDRPEAVAAPAKDAQVALMDGAQNVALPETPSEETPTEEPREIVEEPEKTEKSTIQSKAKTYWSWMRRDSRDSKRKVHHIPRYHKDTALNINRIGMPLRIT